jgi:hypothetical protein
MNKEWHNLFVKTTNSFVLTLANMRGGWQISGRASGGERIYGRF